MAANNGPQNPPEATVDGPPSVPAMPAVPPDDLYRGAPYILLQGLRHCVGWQDIRKTGPRFVVTSRRPGGSIKALQRFPLSEQGWADAWQVLSRIDADAAAAVAARLAELDAGRRAAEALVTLDARSLCKLASVTFDGGSGTGSLSKGQRYDLRFLDDRITVCAQGSTHAFVNCPTQLPTPSRSARQPGSRPQQCSR